MKLQKTTCILAMTALLLGGFVAFQEIPQMAKQQEIQPEESKILEIKSEDIQELTLEIRPKTLTFERTSDANQSWQMKQPKDIPANNAAISFLVNLLVEAKRDRAFTIPANQTQEYGLDKPWATIKIEIKDGKKYQIRLGKSDFEDKALYAQIEGASQNLTSDQLEILLVSKDFQYAIERDPLEWEQSKP